MLDNLKYQVNLPALFITLSVLFVCTPVGLWYVRKTTGRSIREMLTLLAAAIVFILLMAPSIFIFDGWLNSPDRSIRHTIVRLLGVAYLPVALLVWWAFNRLAKSRRPRRRNS
jgi:Na+(H+)/acetate symporter ActP